MEKQTVVNMFGEYTLMVLSLGVVLVLFSFAMWQKSGAKHDSQKKEQGGD